MSLREELGARLLCAMVQNQNILTSERVLADSVFSRKLSDAALEMADTFMAAVDQACDGSEGDDSESELEPVAVTPEPEEGSTPIESLEAVSGKVQQLLKQNGIRTVEQLKAEIEKGTDLTSIKGIGPETVVDIKAAVSIAE